MKKFINVTPKCECGGSLELQSIQIDLVNCAYILFLNCIVCGEEVIHILQLTDFIEINQILNGDN